MSKLVAVQTVVGKISTTQGINGALTTGKVIVNDELKLYDGIYEVTPKVKMQKLETKNRFMSDDVTIHSVPVYEVSNASGGNTVYIAKE